MPANPILVLGIGDVGAKAIASMKHLIRTAFGEDVPGIGYLAIVATGSQSSDENARHLDQFTVDLRSLLAMELGRAPSLASGSSAGLERLLSPEWAVDGDETKSQVFQSLLSAIREALAGVEVTLEDLRQLAGVAPKAAGEYYQPGLSEAATSSEPAAAGGGLQPEWLKRIREIQAEQAKSAVSGLVAQLRLEEGFRGPSAFGGMLRELEVELEAILCKTREDAAERRPAVSVQASSQARSRRDLPHVVPAETRTRVEELLALQAYEFAVSEALGEVKRIKATLARARELIRGTVGSDLSLNLVPTETGWSLDWLLLGLERLDKLGNPITVDTMATELYRKLGLSDGIGRLGASLKDEMDLYCREALRRLLGDRMVLSSHGGASRFVHLESDEFVLLSPERDLDPEQEHAADGGGAPSKDEFYYFDYSRKAAKEALWKDESFRAINDRIGKKIIALTNPTTEIRMNEVLKKYNANLSFDSSIVRIMVLGDIGDTLSGALLQDVAGMAVQHCQRRGGGGWRAIAIMSAPDPAIGYLKNAIPQARACATLKEIYYWWEQNKYEKSKESKRVQVDSSIFNAVYLLENTDDSKQAAVESCAASATELALLQTFDTQYLFTGLEDTGRTLRRPVLSFGVSRLVCPKSIIAKYDSHRIAAEAAQAFCETSGGEDVLVANEDAFVQLSRLIEQLKGTKDKELAEVKAQDWWETFADIVGRSLDEGAVSTRLAAAQKLLALAKEKLEREGRVLVNWYAELVRQMEEFMKRLEGMSGERVRLLRRARAATLWAVGALAGSLLSAGAALALPTGLVVLPGALESYEGAALGLSALLASLFGGLSAWRFKASARMRRDAARLEEERGQAQREHKGWPVISLAGFRTLRGLYSRVVELERQVEALREDLLAAIPEWRKKADSIKGSLPISLRIPDSGGTVTLISETYLARQFEKVRDDLLNGSLEKGFGGHCKLKFRRLLGRNQESVALGVPAEIENLVLETHREDFSAFNVLKDMAHSGENIGEYIWALKITSKPRARYNPAKIDGVLGVRYVMALENEGQLAEEPLQSARVARGIPDAGQPLDAFTSVDPSRIVLCQVWRKPIDIGAVEAVSSYTEAFDSAPKHANIGLDVEIDAAKYSLVERVASDTLRTMVVKAMVLGVIAGPGQTSASEAAPRGIESVVELYKGNPERARRLREVVESHIASIPNQEELVAWLEWVKTNENYRKRIGLTEGDTNVIDGLIDEVRSDRRAADFI